MERLIIGSNNPAKLGEWRKHLGSVVEVLSIADVGEFPEPEETGSTFVENARIKASYYARLTRNFVLADDAGFEVNALNGEPGVKSRRILPDGSEGNDEQCIEYILTRMKNVSKEKRAARLVLRIALANPSGQIIYEGDGSIHGLVTQKLSAPITPGFPYRSILFIPEAGKTYAELSEKEHDKMNHRKKAAQELIEFIKKL